MKTRFMMLCAMCVFTVCCNAEDFPPEWLIFWERAEQVCIIKYQKKSPTTMMVSEEVCLKGDKSPNFPVLMNLSLFDDGEQHLEFKVGATASSKFLKYRSFSVKITPKNATHVGAFKKWVGLYGKSEVLNQFDVSDIPVARNIEKSKVEPPPRERSK